MSVASFSGPLLTLTCLCMHANNFALSPGLLVCGERPGTHALGINLDYSILLCVEIVKYPSSFCLCENSLCLQASRSIFTKSSW